MRLLLSYEIDPASAKPALTVREGELAPGEVGEVEGELRRRYDRLVLRDGQVVELRARLRAFGEGPARFRVHVGRGRARNPALWLSGVDGSAWVREFVAEARGEVRRLARARPGADLGAVVRACAGLGRADPGRLALQLLAGYLEHMEHNGPAGLGVLACDCPACALRKAARG